MNQDREQSEFEVCYSEGSSAKKLRLCLGEGGIYKTDRARRAWFFWKASAARHTARIAALEAEVVRLKNRESKLIELAIDAGEDWYRYVEVDTAPISLVNHLQKAIGSLDEAMKGGA